jgi:AraC-like DNA-binding protein/mannose-6-phosphate isomerase-like protein (cupin superfamily)
MAKIKQLEKMQVDETLREIESHGGVAFPLQVYVDEMDRYELGKIPWHWHPEIAFSIIHQGSVVVSVPDQQVTLQKGDGYFINSNVLHQIQSLEEHTVFYSVVFSPSLLYGFQGSVIEQKYINPLIQNPELWLLSFNGEERWHDNIVATLQRCFHSYEQQEDGWELSIVIDLSKIMLMLYRETQSWDAQPNNHMRIQDEERTKTMLDYIHLSYMNKLSLKDIANAAYISTSECCRCFKRILKTTPFRYLNRYRLSAAAQLLKQGFSATYVFKETGFCSQSYFTVQFKEVYGCTPGDYKKQLS